MNKLLLGLVALLTLAASCPAHSADIAAGQMPMKAPAALAPVSWSGFYIGGNIGYGIDSGRLTEGFMALPGAAVTSNSTISGLSGVIGGGQIGYNLQVAPNWLFGLEADFQGSGQNASANFNLPVTPLFDTASAKINDFGTVRGRIGLITNGVTLWYVTGGLAYGQSALNLTTNAMGLTPLAASFTSTRTGWTIGGGLESWIYGNWTAKIEYLYMDLGSMSAAPGVTPLGGGPVVALIPTRIALHDNIIRTGLNYHF